MNATLIVLADYRARQQRLLRPLIAAHHAAALTAVACAYAWWPLHVAGAVVGAYAETHRAVLRILD